MRKSNALTFIAVLAAAVVFLYAYRAFTAPQYEKFPPPGGLALVDVSFQYPEKWTIRQEKGKIDPYAQVMVFGPRNASDTFTASFIVRKTLASGNRQTVEDMKQNELNRFFLNKAVENETTGKLDGVEGQGVIVTYTLPANYHSGSKAVPTDMKTRYFVLKRNEYIYEIMYDADQKDYPLYKKHFERLLKTFRFSA